MAPQGQLITNLSQNRAAPKWTFAARSEEKSARPSTPGPGSYNGASRAKERSTPSWGFGKSQRELARTASAPGPGQYQPQDRGRSTTPLFAFGKDARDKKNNFSAVTPGPGSYAPNISATKSHAPQYTAMGRRDGASSARGLRGGNADTPGPGSYGTDRSNSCRTLNGGFGKASRDEKGKDATPGPGAYNSKNIIGGQDAQKYSIRRRVGEAHSGADLHNSTPGPGGYGGLYTQFG
eukprot:TRINITY_DN5184_c0_g1_i1.p1 TRINITY_DN5184_c0_g1~~TRINITY_DN5184_c0_g1_i1.p1  ORF type:complete len:251 (+),score=25.81 TRINITY_DN5184_c0_g1_i1:46-753(+)